MGARCPLQLLVPRSILTCLQYPLRALLEDLAQLLALDMIAMVNSPSMHHSKFGRLDFAKLHQDVQFFFGFLHFVLNFMYIFIFKSRLVQLTLTCLLAAIPLQCAQTICDNRDKTGAYNKQSLSIQT